jgi:hypothetical protein
LVRAVTIYTNAGLAQSHAADPGAGGLDVTAPDRFRFRLAQSTRPGLSPAVCV